MAVKPSKEIQDFMAKYRVAPEEIWQVPDGAWVAKHKALERVAAEQGISFDQPSIATRDYQNEGVTMLVTGHLGDRSEWSFGEASTLNLTRKSEKRPLYPWAMAEKRAKDRVILKLLQIHGALYSEDEMDEARENPYVTRPEDIFDDIAPAENIPLADHDVIQLPKKNSKEIFESLQQEIWAIGEYNKLMDWGERNKNRVGSLPKDWQGILRGVFAEHRDAIRNQDEQDNRRIA